MIPKYARYKYCIDKSIEFIISENINHFPFDSDNIIEDHKWARLKYSHLASKHKVGINDIIDAYGTQDGYSLYTGRNYTIAYNDTHIPRRIYFTKLHEIGHIYLNHFIDFNETRIMRSSLTEKQYKVLENEANCFARNVIAPATIVKNLNLKTEGEIANYFGITNGAAKTRLELLKDDYKYIDKKQTNELTSFFDKYIYKHYCPRCGYKFISRYAKYCPICGHDKLFLGDGFMDYDSMELNKRHKATICPICGNENTDIEGDYCQICGHDIRNRCTNPNCEADLDGDSRYCPYCSTESSFLLNSYLDDWETAKSKMEYTDEIPFDNNFEPPF